LSPSASAPEYCKAGMHRAACSLAPTHPAQIARAQAQGYLLDRKRLMSLIPPEQFRRTPHDSASLGRERSQARRPDRAAGPPELLGTLEHFPYYCRVPRRSLNHASALSGVICGSNSVMASSRASLVRALAARSSCLSLAQAFSMGLRSGE
jgi:hypothetical protein